MLSLFNSLSSKVLLLRSFQIHHTAAIEMHLHSTFNLFLLPKQNHCMSVNFFHSFGITPLTWKLVPNKQRKRTIKKQIVNILSSGLQSTHQLGDKQLMASFFWRRSHVFSFPLNSTQTRSGKILTLLIKSKLRVH